MAKGNKNTHLSYIIEFNAIIPVKKKTNLIKLLQWKKIYTVTPFFLMMKRYKFIHIDKLQKCSCYLTSLLSYWDRLLLVHTFQFFNKKIPLYTVSNHVYIFREWVLFWSSYIQSFTVTEYLNVKEDTGFFPRKAWESWSRYSKRCQVNTPFNCN